MINNLVDEPFSEWKSNLLTILQFLDKPQQILFTKRLKTCSDMEVQKLGACLEKLFQVESFEDAFRLFKQLKEILPNLASHECEKVFGYPFPSFLSQTSTVHSLQALNLDLNNPKVIFYKNLFIGTFNQESSHNTHYLYAFNSTTGSLKWGVALEGRVAYLKFAMEKVLVAIEGTQELLVIAPTTGRMEKKYPLPEITPMFARFHVSDKGQSFSIDTLGMGQGALYGLRQSDSDSDSDSLLIEKTSKLSLSSASQRDKTVLREAGKIDPKNSEEMIAYVSSRDKATPKKLGYAALPPIKFVSGGFLDVENPVEKQEINKEEDFDFKSSLGKQSSRLSVGSESEPDAIDETEEADIPDTVENEESKAIAVNIDYAKLVQADIEYTRLHPQKLSTSSYLHVTDSGFSYLKTRNTHHRGKFELDGQLVWSLASKNGKEKGNCKQLGTYTAYFELKETKIFNKEGLLITSENWNDGLFIDKDLYFVKSSKEKEQLYITITINPKEFKTQRQPRTIKICLSGVSERPLELLGKCKNGNLVCKFEDAQTPFFVDIEEKKISFINGLKPSALNSFLIDDATNSVWIWEKESQKVWKCTKETNEEVGVIQQNQIHLSPKLLKVSNGVLFYF